MQPSQKPKRNWKKILLILLVVLFLISLVGIGLYLLIPIITEQPASPTQKQATPSAKISTPSAKKEQPKPKDETANWKVYTSTRDGYSIKYPSEWIVIPESTGGGPYFRNFDPSSKPPEDPPRINYPKGYLNVRVTLLKDNLCLSQDDNIIKSIDWYKKLGMPDEIICGGPKFESLEKYQFNGLDAKRAKSVFDETNEIIILPHKNHVYEIILYPYGASNNETVKLMLSTFRFD